jgi:hypothetical protein
MDIRLPRRSHFFHRSDDLLRRIVEIIGRSDVEI